MLGKRSLDGLMSHLVDQVALCGEHGEFHINVSGFIIRVLASKRNMHNCMVFGCLVPARRAVAAFVVPLAYLSQNRFDVFQIHKVMILRHSALTLMFTEYMTWQHIS